jgi:hypothetical protein
VRRFLNVLLFLLLVNEGTDNCVYGKSHMFAPFFWVHGLFFDPILSVRPLDVVLAGILIFASVGRRRSARMTLPLRRALFIAAAAVMLALVYGLIRGGDARAAGWQSYLMFTTVLATFTFASVNTTAEHYVAVLKVVVIAAVYRAIMGMFFYVFFVRNGVVNPNPGYVTAHEDTVLWSVSIGFLLVRVLETPTFKIKVAAAAIVPLLLVAIQLNNRRLAWITLGGELVALYVMIPPSAVKRRVKRIAAILVPVLALYAIVGWGRTDGIFRPLQAFQSVSSAEDNSTKARIVENLGLIATANQSSWLMGTGWGHKYVEISDKYQIYMFELWPYVPHNGVLGLLAYTGIVGFFGYWMTLPVAVYLHARTAKLAARPVDRLIGLVGVMQIVACANQWYGDMGYFAVVSMYILATCFAAALRVPVSAGVWGDQDDRAEPPLEVAA